MTGKYAKPTSTQGLCHALLIFAAILLLLTGCGGGSGDTDSQGTGSISFSVQWDRSAASRTAYPPRSDVSDCSDVDTVSAAVYSADGSLLQTGGPWNCSDGDGIITDVPAGYTVRVAVVGLYGTSALYYGQSPAFYLSRNSQVDAGTITAGSFIPTLLSPANGATVAPSGLTLTWQAVTGAAYYRVTIYDSDYGVVQEITAGASATPSCQPDTSAYMQDATYHWRVQTVDGAGNLSSASTDWVFYIHTNEPPVASILYPYDGATVAVNQQLDCTGQASDLEDGNITASSQLAWEIVEVADPGNVFTGNGLTFSIGGSFLNNAGTYTITFTATDSAGATDTVSLDVEAGYF
jgi:hypothetical protein